MIAEFQDKLPKIQKDQRYKLVGKIDFRREAGTWRTYLLVDKVEPVGKRDEDKKLEAKGGE